jgi:hypothetical protein
MPVPRTVVPTSPMPRPSTSTCLQALFFRDAPALFVKSTMAFSTTKTFSFGMLE